MLSLTDLALTIAEADAYAASRGLSWSGTDAEKTVALRRGQDYIAGKYNGKWATEWTVAPDAVKYAITEAAVRELAVPGGLDPDVTLGRTVKQETVGPLSVTYAGAGGAGAQKPIVGIIDALLSGLILSGASGWLLRA